MIGLKYRDDEEFLAKILFDENDVTIWYYLKLASFEFAEPNVQQANLHTDLSSTYQTFTLLDLQRCICFDEDEHVKN
jgi:hypothetical protein